VKDGQVVGEGATQPPGGPHAEKVALEQAGAQARGATLYVTLEPCSRHNRTPPCTTAIAEAGIARVHLAVLDPNPQQGQGKTELEAAGIATLLGEGEREARRVSEAFFKWITTGLPFVYGKFAASLDGKIATNSGESQWITGEAARSVVHGLRSQVDAIMVGSNTALRDDPRLTPRQGDAPSERSPTRVVVDTAARLPATARMLGEPGKSLIATTSKASAEARRALEAAGAEVLTLPEGDGGVDLASLLAELGERELTSILVEGGGELLGSFFEQGLVDKVLAFIAPVVIGGRDAPTAVAGHGIASLSQALRLRDVEVQQLDGDVLITGYKDG
jgi:diaminohydroxyphosphoribosylaminopyrimidine deaminase/5-amino-6-(5-phosphoribosylamino)uracil reductase